MKKGFTLVELMIVISILTLILAIALPSIQKQKYKHYEKVSSVVIEKSYEIHGSVTNRAGYTAVISHRSGETEDTE